MFRFARKTSLRREVCRLGDHIESLTERVNELEDLPEYDDAAVAAEIGDLAGRVDALESASDDLQMRFAELEENG